MEQAEYELDGKTRETLIQLRRQFSACLSGVNKCKAGTIGGSGFDRIRPDEWAGRLPRSNRPQAPLQVRSSWMPYIALVGHSSALARRYASFPVCVW